MILFQFGSKKMDLGSVLLTQRNNEMVGKKKVFPEINGIPNISVFSSVHKYFLMVGCNLAFGSVSKR